MHKLLSLFILFQLVFGINANCQKIDWGTLQKHKSKYYEPAVLGEDEKYLYMYSQDRKDLFLESFDKGKLNKKYSNEIEFPDGKKKFFTVERVSMMNSNFAIFCSYYNKKNKNTQIVAYKADLKKGKLDKEKVELLNVAVEKKKRRGNFNVVVSQDKKRALIVHRAYYKKQDETRYSFVLLNEELDIEMEKEATYEGKEIVTYKNFFIDNNGSVYFQEKKNGEYFVTSYDADKDYEVWSEKIDISKMEANSVITSMTFKLNAENHFVVTGYYNRSGELRGAFFMKIDNFSKEIIAQKISEFDQAFVESFKSQRQKKKEARKARKGKQIKERKRFKIGDYYKDLTTLPLKDGGMILLGEHYNHFYYYSRGGEDIGEYYQYKDVIAISFDKEGNMRWANRLPKHQHFWYRASGANTSVGAIFASLNFMFTGSYGVSFFSVPLYNLAHYSYIPVLENDRLSVAFLDHKKNFERREDEMLKPMGKPKRGVPVVYHIDLETGAKKKELYLDSKDFDVMIAPSTYYQSEQGANAYIMGKSKKKFKFGQIELNPTGKRGKKKRRRRS